MEAETKRRIIKRVLIAGAALLVLVLIALLVVFFYARSLAAERSVPLDARYFITPDTSAVVLVKLRPADDGVRELFERVAAAYDAGRSRAGFWEKTGYFLLGFDRPSDIITRPLPAELAIVVRYDEAEARFDSYAVCSVSGLAAVMRHLAGNLSSYAPDVAEAYGVRTHSDETMFVPDDGAGPPGPRLSVRDVEVLIPPSAFSGACWSVVKNNILLSRRPGSLALAVDHVKGIYGHAVSPQPALINAVLPDVGEEVDARAALINRHGELACLLGAAAKLLNSQPLLDWLKTQRAQDDLSTFPHVALSADVQPADTIVIDARLAYHRRDAAGRLVAVLTAAFAACRPPPPIEVRITPTFGPREVAIRITISNVGRYCERTAQE